MRLSLQALTCRIGPSGFLRAQHSHASAYFSSRRACANTQKPEPETEVATTQRTDDIAKPSMPSREFMTFSDVHIQEYIRHLHLAGDVSKKLHRTSSLPTIQCGTKVEKSAEKQKIRQDAPMPLQEIMPGVLEGLETSYKFQSRVVEMMKSQGIDVVAWRVAGTNNMFLRQWGIQTPIVAPVFSTMLYKDDEELSINKHRIMYLEVNFAFRLGKDMDITELVPEKKDEVTIEEDKPIEVPVNTILPYIDAFYPVIDFTSSRYPVRAPHSSALVADFVGGAAVAMGEAIPVEKWKEHSMAEHPCVLFLGDEPIATGKGEFVLGNPLQSVVNLAKNFVKTQRSQKLEKGTIVLTGPCTNALPIKTGKYTAHFGPMGKVTIHVNE